MADIIQIVVQAQDDASGALNQIATGALRSLGDAAVDMAGRAVQALAGFGASSVQAAGDFEQGMAGFANATGRTLADSGKSLDDFKQLFISLGKELPVSTAEVQQAATAMATGGIDPATIAAGGLRDTINFAAAALKGDLVQAAQISAKTMQAWTNITDSTAQKTEFLTHAQNLMTQATTAASTSVDQLFLGLSNVGGTARLAGVSFDQTVTALAQLTPAFSSSADAGTSFKTFLARLQPTTKPAIEAMKDLGLYSDKTGSAFYNAQGNFVGMAAAEQLLHSATKNLTDQQRAQYLQTIFGNDAIRAAGVFATQGADGYNALAVSIGKQTTVQEAAARNQATFNTAIENFKGSIEALQITIGSALLPVLTQLFNNTLAPAVNTVTEFATTMAQAADPIQFLVSSIDQAIPGFAAFVAALVSGAQAVVSFVQSGNNLQAILAGIGTAAAVGIGLAVASLAVAAAPIVALVAAGALLYSAWTNDFAGIQEIVASLAGAFSAVLPVLTFLLNSVISPGINLVTQFAQAMLGSADAMAGLPGVLQSVVVFFGDLWVAGEQIATAFNLAGTGSATFAAALDQVGVALGLPAGLLGAVVGGIQNLVAAIWPAVTAVAGFVAGTTGWFQMTSTLMQTFGITLGGIIAQAITVLNNYATVWIDLGTTIFNVLSALMSGDLAGAWTALTSGLAQVVADYQTYAASLGALIGQIATAIINAVVTYGPQIAAQVLTWGQAFVDWVTPYIPIVLGALANLVGQAWAWVQAQAPGWIAQLASWGQAFADWVTPYIPVVLGALGNLIAQAWAWVQAQAPGWVQQLASWGQALADWVAPYIPVVLGALGGLLSQAWAWVQQQAPGWVSQLASWGQSLAGWVEPAIPQVLGALGNLASSFLGWVGEQAAPIADKFTTWAAGVAAWIPGAITDFLAAWPEMLSRFLDWIATGAGPILEKLGDWALAFVKWVGPAIPDMVVALGGILAAIVVFIVETVATLANKLAQWGPPFYEWIHTKAEPALISALAGLGKSIVDWIAKAVTWLGTEAGKIGKSLVDGIKQGIQNAWAGVTSWLSAQIAKIPEPIRKALKIGSPSRLMAEQVGQPIVEGIALGIQQATPKVTEKMLDLASKMIEVVDRGVGAFGKLSQLGRVPTAAIQTFADTIQDTLSVFAGMVDRWDKAAMSAASQFSRKAGEVVDTLSKGVDFLAKLGALGAIPKSQITRFVDAIAETMNQLIAVSTRDVRIALSAAVDFALSAGKILEAIGKGVDGLAKLNGFAAPAIESIRAFRIAAQTIVGSMAYAATTMANVPIASAVAFAESAGKILEVVGKGTGDLAKLNDFTAPAIESIRAFRVSVQTVVNSIAYAATLMVNVPVGMAVSFADSAGKILDLLGKGVENLAKLSDFTAPTIDSIRSFRIGVQTFVGSMAYAAQQMASVPVGAAAQFAEAAGKIVGIIKPAVDGFKALADLGPVAIDQMLAFGNLIDRLVFLFYQVATDMSTDAVEAAAQFAESAGKVIAILKNGVDGLNALSNLGPVAIDQMLAFGNLIDRLVFLFYQVATDMSVEAAQAAATFADSAGKVVGVLKTGVDGLNALSTLGPVADSAIQAFVAALHQVVGQIASAATQFDADALKAAALFAESAGKIVGVLKNGVDGLSALQDLRPVADSSIQIFVSLLNQIVSQIATAASTFDSDALKVASVFAEAGAKVVGVLKAGVEGFIEVDGFAGITQAALTRFGDGLRIAVQTMASLSSEFSTEALSAATAFANAAQQSVDFLKKGVDGLKKLAELKDTVELGANMDKFAQGLRSLITTMSALAQTISGPMLVEANRMALSLDAIITTLSSAQTAIGKLAETTAGLTIIGKNYSSGVDGLLSMFKATVFPPIEDVGAQIPIVFANGITKSAPQAQAALQSLIAGLVQTLAGLASQVAAPANTIGQNIAVGIANGISATTPAIQNAVIAAVNAAIATANAGLGIASPSKVFFTIGQQTGQGQVAGMDAMRPAVAAAGARMAASSVPAARNPFAGVRLPTLAAPAPRTTNTSTSTITNVTIQIPPGGSLVQAAPSHNPDQIADVVISKLQKRTRVRFS